MPQARLHDLAIIALYSWSTGGATEKCSINQSNSTVVRNTHLQTVLGDHILNKSRRIGNADGYQFYYLKESKHL